MPDQWCRNAGWRYFDARNAGSQAPAWEPKMEDPASRGDSASVKLCEASPSRNLGTSEKRGLSPKGQFCDLVNSGKDMDETWEVVQEIGRVKRSKKPGA